MTTKTPAHTPAGWPFKLGKKPARPDAVKLKLTTYAPKINQLPKPPRAGYGHYPLVSQFPMFANDLYGDCVEAEAGHSTQLVVAEGRGTVSFTDNNILSMYHDVAGFDIDDPSTDQGTDMERAASWRRHIGIQDATGARHKIAAYVALDPGNIDQLDVAAFVFGFASVGIEFPAFAMDQFDRNGAHTIWDVQRTNTKIEGGHCVCVMGRATDGNYVLATWGRLIKATPRFLAKYMDEAIVMLSKEVLFQGRNVEGLNQTALYDDLRHVTSVRAPRPSDTVSHKPSRPRPAPKKTAPKAAPAKAAAKKAAPAKKATPAKKAPAKKRTR